MSDESPAIKQLNPVYAIFWTALPGSQNIQEISTGTQKRVWELDVGALDTWNTIHPGRGCAGRRPGAEGLSIKRPGTHAVQLKGITCPGDARLCEQERQDPCCHGQTPAGSLIRERDNKQGMDQ